MTIEQLLKTKGYTDQELKDLEPMLANAKFRKTLEDEITKMETDLTEYDNWFTKEITPEVNALRQKAAEAEAEAAAQKARFEAYQKSLMKRQGEQQDPAAAAAAAEEEARRVAAAKKEGGLDPSKYVTADTFNAAYDKTGEAIASAINITTQHMQLFPGQFLDMEQLRLEAKNAKKPVKLFWEEKYNVASKRNEIEAKKKQEEEARIRSDERQKVMVEFGGSNPNLRPLAPSSSPFIERKKADAGKQPWEKNESDLTKARIEKAIQKAAGRGELAAV